MTAQAPARLGCETCPIGPPFVGGEWFSRVGSPVLLILGIGPWKNELKERKPFVGASGRLLRSWAIRKNREGSIYFTNSVQCGIRTPTKDHLLACGGRLRAELEQIHPHLVLCLGDVAKRAYQGIGWAASMEAVAHPASVFYPGGPSIKNWRDRMDAAWARLSAEFTPVEKPLSIKLTGRTTLAVDTEYKGSVHDGYDICVVFDGETATAYGSEPGNCAALTDHLERCDDVVFHHAVNDVVSLAGRGVVIPERVEVHCTMTAKGVLDPGGSRDLKVITTNMGYVSKGLDIAAWRRGKVDDVEAVEYCKDDTRRTMLAWQKYRAAAMAHQLYRETYQPLLRVLANMGRLAVDQVTLASLAAKYERKQADLEERLGAYASINWYSYPQVATYLKDTHQVTLPETDQGHSRVDEEALEALTTAYPGIVEARLVVELRGTKKMLSTYIYPLQKRGCLETVYNPVGARTGRMSSSQMNVQNIPEEIRTAIVAEPDQVFVMGDYDAHEIRVAAWISRDQQMLADVNTADYHTTVAQALGGEIRSKEERTMWKHISFGSLYIGTWKTVMRSLAEIGITLDADQEQAEQRAAKHLCEWWERYTGYMNWIGRVQAMARSKGQIIAPTGRSFAVKPSADISVWRGVINEMIQGTAADFTARSILRMDRAGLRPRIDVHDEIVASCPLGNGEWGQRVLRECMLEEDAPLEVKKVRMSRRWHEPEVGDGGVQGSPQAASADLHLEGRPSDAGVGAV
jgi:DNA polymerase I-like protein with 3'-5' exonuclease and polymerase domains